MIAVYEITVAMNGKLTKPISRFFTIKSWAVEDMELSIWVCLLQCIDQRVNLAAQISSDFHSPANGPVVLDDQRRVAAKTCCYGDKVARKALFDEIEGAKLVGRNPRIANLLGG